ncbi:MAG: hypothetical protein FJW96_04735 [Actinobacteria bacterium]|nr:hypothetical protein [Actinomycetota bacterium]
MRGVREGVRGFIGLVAVVGLLGGAPAALGGPAPKVPGKPTAVTGAPGNAQVALTWVAPANDGGSPITSYRITPAIGRMSLPAIVTGSTATSFVVTGLTNGRGYTFRVAATNAVGTGLDSAATTTITPVAGVPPGPPTGVAATAGNAQVALTWVAPANGGGSPITQYRVTRTASGGSPVATLTGSTTTSFTITGLVNGTAYTFTVAAVNAAGPGPESSPPVSATPAGPPGALSAVTGQPGNGQVALSWTAPASNGGSAITSYRISRYDAAGVFLASISTGSAATSHTMTGLVNGTAYRFSVAATNGIGTGGDSPLSGSVTPAAVPGQVTGLTAAAGNEQVSLGWTPPASNGGSTILEYRVTRTPSGGSPVTTLTGSTATSFTVTGLANGTAYAFTVAAVNTAGPGAESAPAQATPFGPPAKVTGVSGVPGDGQVALSWVAPSANGSPILRYTVTVSDGSGGPSTVETPTAATSFTVTGLANGTPYTFTVAATNAAGAGATSDPVALTPTAGATVPDPPTRVSGTAGNEQVTVSWAAPASNDGSPISSYRVSRYDANGGFLASVATGSATTSYTMTGLANGIAYRFSVAATNGVGTGADSILSATVTPAAAPSAPSDVTGVAGDGQVTLSWTAPVSNGGSAITGYRITPFVGAVAQTAVLTGSPSTSHVVTGLANGTPYTFRVAAINAVGPGPSSDPSAPLTPTGSTLLVNQMPVISQGLPAFGEGIAVYPPSKGNDADRGPFGGSYRCETPCALVIDLSTVPVAKRESALIAWYNDENGYRPDAIGGQYYNLPRNYTIDVSSAAGGTGAPPASGWQTLVTVTDNLYNGRLHAASLGGANWIRMRVTESRGGVGNNDASFNLDVHDAATGTNDTWLFLGDSITADSMGHAGASFMQQVASLRPGYFPAQINGGLGGWMAGTPLQSDPMSPGLTYIDRFLADFPGRFVALDFGTNEALGGGGSVSSFTANMTALVQKVIAAGKIPVLRRSIPWGCNTAILVNGPSINTQLAALLQQFPQAIAGPDIWAYFQSHQSLISSDCIHPTAAGGDAYRQQYVQAIIGTYGP